MDLFIPLLVGTNFMNKFYHNMVLYLKTKNIYSKIYTPNK
jgi:hypothetical protein